MRILTLGPHKIDTPTVWLGHDIKNPFHVWKSVRGPYGLFVNAQQIIERQWFRKEATAVGLHSALAFKGPIFLDSGGYQLQRRPNLRFSAETLVDLYRAMRPDVGAVLDYPLDIRASANTNRARWLRSVQSAAFMRNRLKDLTLAPVLHGYSAGVIAGRIAVMDQIIPHAPIWCLGSLVPLLHGSYIGSQFATNASQFKRFEARWNLITRLVLRLRQAMRRGEILHVLGAGSISTMLLLFLVGADSVDSSSWRRKAAFGAIQLPGLADRFLDSRADRQRIRKLLTRRCRDVLIRCECPICGDLTLEKRIRTLRRHFEARATHNAHVFISEATAVRIAKQRGHIIDFVLDRLSQIGTYRKMVENAVLPLLI